MVTGVKRARVCSASSISPRSVCATTDQETCRLGAAVLRVGDAIHGAAYVAAGPASGRPARIAASHPHRPGLVRAHRRLRHPPVRPYLTAYEREEKARLQRLRRDTLWLAAYGVDLDTRDIHACLGEAS